MIRPVLLAAALAAASATAVRAQALDLRLSGFGMSSKNSVDNGATTTENTGTMGGLDLTLRLNGIGFGVRTQSGKFGASDNELALGEARLMLGSPKFSAEAAYVRRGYSGALGSRTLAAVRGGARMEIDIGATGLTALASGGAYFNALAMPDQGKTSGWVVETGLRYQPKQFPVFVTLGYRSDTFSEASDTGTRTDNLSGVVLGGGVRLRR